MTRRCFAAVVAMLLAACEETPVINRLAAQIETDVFQQDGSPAVDILWVVDNSRSMAPIQEKIATEASGFIQTLLQGDIDYHIGVITADVMEAGRLRPYGGPPVPGCTGCRWVSRSIACNNATVDPAQLSPEQLADQCGALAVFGDLVRVGAEGNALERSFEQLADALGLEVVDPATGLPVTEPDTGRPLLATPAENEGFLRSDANLLVVFVSDEEESLGNDAPPVRYYERLLALSKVGTGRRLLVVSLVGWPATPEEPSSLPLAQDVCPFVAPLTDGNPTNDAAFRSQLTMSLAEQSGCEDGLGNFAEAGLRYIELACRLGGTVANICDDSYRQTLEEVGRIARRLGGEFRLSFANDLDRGADCIPFSGDEQRLDCDGDGSEESLAVCVTVEATDGTSQVVLRDPNAGWTWDPNAGAVTFTGAYEPPPAARVSVRYWTNPAAACP